MKRFEVRVERRNELGADLYFVFNDRFQTISFNPFDKKQDIARKLRKLADNIENDELMEEQSQVPINQEDL